MAVEHADNAAMRRHVGEQAFDMRARMNKAAFAGALRGGPAGIKPVGRRDREQADIAAVFRHQAYGLDRLRRDRARIGDDDLAIRAGLAQPIGAVDDLLPQFGVICRLICSIGRVESRR